MFGQFSCIINAPKYRIKLLAILQKNGDRFYENLLSRLQHSKLIFLCPVNGRHGKVEVQ